MARHRRDLEAGENADATQDVGDGTVATPAPPSESPPVDEPPTAQPAPGGLAKIARKGAAISAVTLVVVQVMSLLSTLVLARLLTPAEVGIYAAGTVLSGFLVSFSEGGLKGALVQRDGDDKHIDDASDTVFWATAASGVGMTLLAIAAAPIVALVFDSPLAGEIAAICSGMLLMHSLTNVPDGLMQRRFNFKRRLIIDPARSFAYGAVTIVCAVLGLGVWSLVIGNYASMATWLIGTWVLAKWRPGRGKATVRLWRQMANFAYPILVQSVVGNVREAAQTSMLGRGLGEGPLGQYRYGSRLGQLPGVAVVQIASYVMFPAFSRLANDAERLKRAFLRALQWLWFVSAPAALLLVVLGQQAVVVLLGAKWSDAGLFVVAMAGYAAAVSLQSVASEAIKGTGRSKLFNWTSAADFIFGLGLIAALLPFGLVGVGIAISTSEMIIGIICLVLARKVIAFTLGELMGRLVPPLVGAVVAAAAIYALDRFVVHSGRFGTVAGFFVLAGETLLFGGVYLLVMRIIAPTMVSELTSGLRRLRKRGSSSAGPDDGDAEGALARVPDDVPDPEPMVAFDTPTIQFWAVGRTYRSPGARPQDPNGTPTWLATRPPPGPVDPLAETQLIAPVRPGTGQPPEVSAAEETTLLRPVDAEPGGTVEQTVRIEPVAGRPAAAPAPGEATPADEQAAGNATTGTSDAEETVQVPAAAPAPPRTHRPRGLAAEHTGRSRPGPRGTLR